MNAQVPFVVLRGNESRGRVVCIRLSNEEHELLIKGQSEAGFYGVPFSSFCRSLLFRAGSPNDKPASASKTSHKKITPKKEGATK